MRLNGKIAIVTGATRGIGRTPERIPADAERQPEIALGMRAQDAGVAFSGAQPGAPLHFAVVMAEEIFARAEMPRAQQPQQRRAWIAGAGRRPARRYDHGARA